MDSVSSFPFTYVPSNRNECVNGNNDFSKLTTAALMHTIVQTEKNRERKAFSHFEK